MGAREVEPAETPVVDASLFISATPIRKEVELSDGTKHALYFREVPAKAFRRYSKDVNSDDPEVSDMATPRLIAASLCDPDGKLTMTPERAATLKASASNAILLAVLDVNGMGTRKNA